MELSLRVCLCLLASSTHTCTVVASEPNNCHLGAFPAAPIDCLHPLTVSSHPLPCFLCTSALTALGFLEGLECIGWEDKERGDQSFGKPSSLLGDVLFQYGL